MSVPGEPAPISSVTTADLLAERVGTPGPHLAPVRTEVATMLRNDPTQRGAVFRQLEAGVTETAEIVAAGAAANAGAVSNLRATIEGVLDLDIPTAPSLARFVTAAARALLRSNPQVSPAARAHLEHVIDLAEAVVTDPVRVEVEEADLARRSSELEAVDLGEAGGVYVYTFPHYLNHSYEGTDRYLLKVGCTTGTAGARVREQARATAAPEDPRLMRVYQPPAGTHVLEAERLFHRLLDAAGHDRSRAGSAARREWFATSFDFLDTIAEVLGFNVLRA